MDDYLKDERFKCISSDPKFKGVPRSQRKIKIDKRFQSMFTDKNFQLNYAVDKRGRSVKESQTENFKKYYDLSSESQSEAESEETETKEMVNVRRTEINLIDLSVKTKEKYFDEKSDLIKKKVEESNDLNDDDFKENIIKTKQISTVQGDTTDEVHKSKLSEKLQARLQDMSFDYARGIGILQSESSSDESSSEDSEEEIEHAWGELDKDAEMVDEISNRLAVCNMDWDRINATDLMVLFHSFLPPEGVIESITVYPSEFGLERTKEEELKGPKELVDKTNENENSDNEEERAEGKKYHMEKLREYQLKRLKYFYAVIVCNSTETANKLYKECDGLEYESSATRIDLRFIPDGMEFDQEPRETCTSLPDLKKYKPRLFANTALQQGKVDLTWDETDPKRVDLTRKFAAGEELQDEDLKKLIATSSDDESDEINANVSDTLKESSKNGDQSEVENDVCGENDKIMKYRSLLADLQQEKEKKERDEVQMEITWDIGLQNKTQLLINEKLKSKLTPFEKMIENKKERRQQKFASQKKPDDDLLSDDDLVSHSSSDDDIGTKIKKRNKKKHQDPSLSDDQEKAELELLLAEDEQEKGRRHFSLKGIQEQEKGGKKKWKKQSKKKEIHKEEDSFKIDVADERFTALYTSHHYNIDPTDSHFRKTKAMEQLISEKQKRKKGEVLPAKKKPKVEEHTMDPELLMLLKSVKKKSKGH